MNTKREREREREKRQRQRHTRKRSLYLSFPFDLNFYNTNAYYIKRVSIHTKNKYISPPSPHTSIRRPPEILRRLPPRLSNLIFTSTPSTFLTSWRISSDCRVVTTFICMCVYILSFYAYISQPLFILMLGICICSCYVHDFVDTYTCICLYMRFH